MRKLSCLFTLILFFYIFAPTCLLAFDKAIIEGLRIEKLIKGKRAYSIEADKAVFRNKRIAFLNLAFIKVIDLEGVNFVLCDNGQVIKEKHFDRAVYELNSKRLLDESGELIFSE